MSWLDDLSGLFGGGDGPDLSTLDPITLPDQWMTMDNMPNDLIGGLSPDDWNQIIGDQPENGSFIGPGDTDPNGFTPQDYTDLDQYNQGLDAGGSGGSGASSGASALSRLFGGGAGGSTAGILSGLLPMLFAGGAGLMNRNATNDATQQTVAGINKASDQASGLINGASQNFTPYINQGQAALAKMASAQPSNIASQFGPLQGNYRPLGSGRALSSLAR